MEINKKSANRFKPSKKATLNKYKNIISNIEFNGS